MADGISTISLPENVKEKGKKASKDVFGYENLSGYIQILINEDAKKRGIKNE